MCWSERWSLSIVVALSLRFSSGGDEASKIADPPQCAPYGDLFPQIWSDFGPIAAHGPITTSNLTELRSLARKWSGWEYYFLEVAILEGSLLYRSGLEHLGPWQEATLQLLALTLERYAEWIPDVYFILSVLDEPYLGRESSRPLPLLASMTTRVHWDIPVPTHAFFETSGGISSSAVRQDFQSWETEEWQAAQARRHPWGRRAERAFFRGHGWDSSNGLLEALPGRGAEACVGPGDATAPFGYRRWYAELSGPGGPLARELDVALTGAPAFAREPRPGRAHAPPVGLPEHARHKYLLHLDGTTASNRLIKLLMLGSVVLKQDSVYEEYFYRNLAPYRHFVPFARDRCSTANLTKTLAWLRAHDAQARAIALEGQRFARRALSTGAAACYWRRLLAVYAALQAFDPRLAVRASGLRTFRGAPRASAPPRRGAP